MTHVIDLLQLSVLAAMLVTTYGMHELGHWAVAQILGVWSPVVSLGWGDRYLVLLRTKHTQFRITTTFLSGGYTMLAIKKWPDGMIQGTATSLGIAPLPTRDLKPWERASILIAGVMVNLMVALLVSYGQLVASGHGAGEALLSAMAQTATDIAYVCKIPFGAAVNADLSGVASFVNAFLYMNIVMIVVNLLPLPTLDGFQLVTAAYEGLTGNEPSERIRKTVDWFNWILLVGAVATALGILVRYMILHPH